MPIVQSLMDKLERTYGKEQAQRVYYSMEATGKGPFAKGAKHHALHVEWAAKNGVPAASGKKKPRPKKGGAPSARPHKAGSRPRARRKT